MSTETTVTEFEYNKDGTIAKETSTVTTQENPAITLGSPFTTKQRAERWFHQVVSESADMELIHVPLEFVPYL